MNFLLINLKKKNTHVKSDSDNFIEYTVVEVNTYLILNINFLASLTWNTMSLKAGVELRLVLQNTPGKH